MDDFFSLHKEELLTRCVLAVIHKYRMKIKAKEIVSDKAFAFESNPTSTSTAQRSYREICLIKCTL